MLTSTPERALGQELPKRPSELIEDSQLVRNSQEPQNRTPCDDTYSRKISSVSTIGRVFEQSSTIETSERVFVVNTGFLE